MAPLHERVPPRAYGGTELVVSVLTEELVRRGHDVTLFASGDSQTAATLVAVTDEPLSRDAGQEDRLATQFALLEEVFERAGDFDVVHFHVDFLHFPATRRARPGPHLTTLHGRLDVPGLAELYRHFPEIPVVSISDHQRLPLPEANWIGTVYHGLPRETFTFSPDGGEGLVFLGRFSPEKGADMAIEIARRAGLPLRIGAKIDPADEEYFDRTIAPLLDGGGVEYLGEVGHERKVELLGGARALLFPIDWPEPFGLVMIEALACGTPVVARPRGSVPEVITDGVTGLLFETVEEGVAAVRRAGDLDRRRCRDAFEERFSARRMADDYLTLYRRLVARGVPERRRSSG